jgi:hypothetical protein
MPTESLNQNYCKKKFAVGKKKYFLYFKNMQCFLLRQLSVVCKRLLDLVYHFFIPPKKFLKFEYFYLNEIWHPQFCYSISIGIL